MKSICGLDCETCELNTTCKGCAATGGKPFGGECMLAACRRSGGNICEMKRRLIDEFNALAIPDMEAVTDLFALRGTFVNLTYSLPGGQKASFWDDDRIYLGNQLRKKNSNRCYGLTADENHLLVCEYGEGGTDAEIVVFKKR